MPIFSKLQTSFQKNAEILKTDMRALVQTKQKIDPETQAKLSDILIKLNFGPKLSRKLSEKLARSVKTADEDSLQKALHHEIMLVMKGLDGTIDDQINIDIEKKPFTIILAGTNGSGKTTSAGKLAFRFSKKGYKVTLAAADTFRAAAVAQLRIWSERAKCSIITGSDKADPASVAFQAMEKAIRDQDDLVIIDTAGRMHTSHNLMDELSKIIRIVSKKHPSAPHKIFLVIEATTGQNALQQITLFQQAAPLSGLIVTKLDGVGKGGVIVRIADDYHLPICALGTGEGIEDFEDFSPRNFTNALLGMTEKESL